MNSYRRQLKMYCYIGLILSHYYFLLTGVFMKRVFRQLLPFIIMLQFSVGVKAATDVDSAAIAPFNGVKLYLTWISGGGDASQCGGKTGAFLTDLEKWSEPIIVDTDNRAGGCFFSMAIIDPANVLQDWGLTLAFSSTDDGGQCGGQGKFDIPIVQSVSQAQSAHKFFLDMDGKPGGCRMRFEVKGEPLRLDTYVMGNHGPTSDGQCPNYGLQTVQPGKASDFVLDTDRRPGGCIMQFNLYHQVRHPPAP
jgi:hypothetical protein